MKKKIILGISSSIAAYKACDLVRLLVKAEFSVHCIMTDHTVNLVKPITLETLSGNRVDSDTFARNSRKMRHISLREGASLLLVAPATANVIGKFASGIADDLLSTTFLSVTCPVLIAPAMNPEMFHHKSVQANIDRLKSWGVHFVGPEKGPVASGEEGVGRLADVDTICEAAIDVIKKS